MIRSKGFVWLANRPGNCGVWGHAGNIFTIEKVYLEDIPKCSSFTHHLDLLQGRVWYATLPPDDWDVDEDEAKTLITKMGTVWGDRYFASLLCSSMTITYIEFFLTVVKSLCLLVATWIR